MPLKNVRGHIATGCLVAALLPAGAMLAQTPIEPDFELCRTARSRAIEAPPAVATELWAPTAPLIPINDTPPWFRKTFFLFGTDGTCPVKPAAVEPAAVEPAKEQPVGPRVAVSETQLPGTVKNLRRTDQR